MSTKPTQTKHVKYMPGRLAMDFLAMYVTDCNQTVVHCLTDDACDVDAKREVAQKHLCIIQQCLRERSDQDHLIGFDQILAAAVRGGLGTTFITKLHKHLSQTKRTFESLSDCQKYDAARFFMRKYWDSKEREVINYGTSNYDHFQQTELMEVSHTIVENGMNNESHSTPLTTHMSGSGGGRDSASNMVDNINISNETNANSMSVNAAQTASTSDDNKTNEDNQTEETVEIPEIRFNDEIFSFAVPSEDPLDTSLPNDSKWHADNMDNADNDIKDNDDDDGDNEDFDIDI